MMKKKNKLTFNDRIKNHRFSDEYERTCRHQYFTIKYSEVLGRDAKYCETCKCFIFGGEI